MGNKLDNMSIWAYRLLLTFATLVWGFGFGLAKYAIAQVGATWVIAIRFLFSGILLLLLLFPHLKKTLNKDILKTGCILGAVSFLGFWTQFLGLGLTTASKNAFLSACYCITVPFIWWVIARKRPTVKSIGFALLCMAGVGLVSLDGSLSISLGDAISILSAFAYGLEIAAIGLLLKDHDILAITTVQQIVSGLIGLTVALITQPLPAPEQFLNAPFLGCMAYVVVMAATFGCLAQNLAQKHISPAEAGLLCSLESVFCALCSVAFFGEVLTFKLVCGFTLIFASIAGSQLTPDAPSSDREPIEESTPLE